MNNPALVAGIMSLCILTLSSALLTSSQLLAKAHELTKWVNANDLDSLVIPNRDEVKDDGITTITGGSQRSRYRLTKPQLTPR